MPTSLTPPGNISEAQDLERSDNTTGDAWTQQHGAAFMVAQGYSPADAALIYGSPPSGPPGEGLGAQFDATQRRGSLVDQFDSVSREKTAAPGSQAPPKVPQTEGGLLSNFLDAIKSPNVEHASYKARVRDIPHEIYETGREAIESGAETLRGAERTAKTAGGRAAGGASLIGDFMQVLGAPVIGTYRAMVGNPAAERITERMQEQIGTPYPGYKMPSQTEAQRAEASEIADAAMVLGPGGGMVPYRRIFSMLGETAPARAVERVFSPTTLSDDSRAAEAIIRRGGGLAARTTAETEQLLAAHRTALQTVPEPQRLRFIAGAVEGGQRDINAIGNPHLRQLAQDIRTEMQRRETALRGLPSTATADYIDNYFPHMWQDPNRARDVFGGGAGRAGSGASLRARTIPTVADGIRQGLVPVTQDPLEMVARYVTSIDRFIASEGAREAALQSGYAQWVRPSVVGASGHPQSFNVPEGWTQLQGRGATRVDGSRLYAPDDFARVYNNFYQTGFDRDWSSIYGSMLRASNFVTATELALSGYHAVTMTQEAMASQIASGIQNIVGGARRGDWRSFFRGAGQVAGSPAAPLTSLARGRAVERAYLGQTGTTGLTRFLGLSPGTPDMARIVGLLERAGGRAVGSRAAQIQTSQITSNYYQAWRQGGRRFLAEEMSRDIPRFLGGRAESIGRSINLITRTMDSLTHPLFNVYVPRLKNGAFYQTMHTWLRQHPNASHADQIAAARMVWDSIDNRFGELVQDNIFWKRSLKLASQLAMRSYSWNMGTIREIAGGAKDVGMGRGIVDSTRAAYVVALPMATAITGAIATYLMTGEAPKGIDDLIAPRTGGKVPGPAVPSARPFGRSQRNEIDERIMVPGYMKDVFGWSNDWVTEAKNKLATLPRSMGQMASNRDWRDLPIFDPDGTVPEWLTQFLEYVRQGFGPITTRQIQQGRKEGSKISTGMALMGLREAPAYLTAPEDYAEQQRRLNVGRQKLKKNIERRQQQLYGGTE